MITWNLERNELVSEDELVCVYQCPDKSWRVAYYPFADKDRNIKTLGEALSIAEQRHKESIKLDSQSTD